MLKQNIKYAIALITLATPFLMMAAGGTLMGIANTKSQQVMEHFTTTAECAQMQEDYKQQIDYVSKAIENVKAEIEAGKITEKEAEPIIKALETELNDLTIYNNIEELINKSSDPEITKNVDKIKTMDGVGKGLLFGGMVSIGVGVGTVALSKEK